MISLSSRAPVLARNREERIDCIGLVNLGADRTTWSARHPDRGTDAGASDRASGLPADCVVQAFVALFQHHLPRNLSILVLHLEEVVSFRHAMDVETVLLQLAP